LLRIGREHLVNIYSAIVGYHHFLEQAPQYLPQPIYSHIIIEFSFLLYLLDKLRSVDWTGKNTWEKRNVSGKLHNVSGGLNITVLNVNDITNQPEREETDSQRHNDVESMPIGMESHALEKIGERLNEKVKIFKIE
jgi:hypothetical protein